MSVVLNLYRDPLQFALRVGEPLLLPVQFVLLHLVFLALLHQFSLIRPRYLTLIDNLAVELPPQNDEDHNEEEHDEQTDSHHPEGILAVKGYRLGSEH